MTRKLKFRPAARRDILRLSAHFAEAPPSVSEEMVRRIEERAFRLTRLPYIGRKLPRGDLRETIIPYGKSRYVIRYEVTLSEIRITRIWHGKEDHPR